VGYLASPVDGALVHYYELNGTYADALGGPSLIPGGVNGRGILGLNDYRFGAGQGLSLAGALPNPGSYSILLDFSLATLSGYRKIIDFAGRTEDAGLYNLETALNLYPIDIGAPKAFQPNVIGRLVFTRDAPTGRVAGYVNGVEQFSALDDLGQTKFAATNNLIHFFNDDTVTAGAETSAGLVDRIVIYDNALNSAQVAALGGPGVPEPGSLALWLAGLASLAVGRLRRPEKAVRQTPNGEGGE
jgi:hypothetical protein